MPVEPIYNNQEPFPVETPEDVARNKRSHTGRFLRRLLPV